MWDDTPTFMIGALGFATGLLVGVATGLLIAPRSGAYTRRQLHNLAEDLEEAASRLAHEAKRTFDETIEHGKRLVS